MAQMLLFSNTVTDAYKETSEAIKNVKLNDKLVIKKTLVEMMKQSFSTAQTGTEAIIL